MSSSSNGRKGSRTSYLLPDILKRRPSAPDVSRYTHPSVSPTNSIRRRLRHPPSHNHISPLRRNPVVLDQDFFEEDTDKIVSKVPLTTREPPIREALYGGNRLSYHSILAPHASALERVKDRAKSVVTQRSKASDFSFFNSLTPKSSKNKLHLSISHPVDLVSKGSMDVLSDGGRGQEASTSLQASLNERRKATLRTYNALRRKQSNEGPSERSSPLGEKESPTLDRFFKKLSTTWDRVHGRTLNPKRSYNMSLNTFDLLKEGHGSESIEIDRSLNEGINLARPKVQQITGDRIRRKPVATVQSTKFTCSPTRPLGHWDDLDLFHDSPPNANNNMRCPSYKRMSDVSDQHRSHRNTCSFSSTSISSIPFDSDTNRGGFSSASTAIARCSRLSSQNFSVAHHRHSMGSTGIKRNVSHFSLDDQPNFRTKKMESADDKGCTKRSTPSPPLSMGGGDGGPLRGKRITLGLRDPNVASSASSGGEASGIIRTEDINKIMPLRTRRKKHPAPSRDELALLQHNFTRLTQTFGDVYGVLEQWEENQNHPKRHSYRSAHSHGSSTSTLFKADNRSSLHLPMDGLS